MDATEVLATGGPHGPGLLKRPHKVFAGRDPVAVMKLFPVAHGSPGDELDPPACRLLPLAGVRRRLDSDGDDHLVWPHAGVGNNGRDKRDLLIGKPCHIVGRVDGHDVSLFVEGDAEFPGDRGRFGDAVIGVVGVRFVDGGDGHNVIAVVT